MPNISPRLGLRKPVATDQFDTDELAENWQTLDDTPGVWLANSTSPPVWGPQHAGMLWSQKDTGLVYRWSGSAFSRIAPLGSIGFADRQSNFAESSGTFQTIAQKTGAITFGRRIMVVANWGKISGDDVEFQITRGATVVHTWQNGSIGGGAMVAMDAPAAGTYTYAFKMRTLAAASNLLASATSPAQLEVIEI